MCVCVCVCVCVHVRMGISTQMSCFFFTEWKSNNAIINQDV